MIELKKAKGQQTLVWRGALSGDGGLEIKHGKSDRQLRTISIPAASCNNNPQKKLDELVAQQILDGYELVGEAPENVKGVANAQKALRAQRAEETIKTALQEAESSTSCSAW